MHLIYPVGKHIHNLENMCRQSNPRMKTFLFSFFFQTEWFYLSFSIKKYAQKFSNSTNLFVCVYLILFYTFLPFKSYPTKTVWNFTPSSNRLNCFSATFMRSFDYYVEIIQTTTQKKKSKSFCNSYWRAPIKRF